MTNHDDPVDLIHANKGLCTYPGEISADGTCCTYCGAELPGRLALANEVRRLRNQGDFISPDQSNRDGRIAVWDVTPKVSITIDHDDIHIVTSCMHPGVTAEQARQVAAALQTAAYRSEQLLEPEDVAHAIRDEIADGDDQEVVP